MNKVLISPFFKRKVKPFAKKYYTLPESINTLIDKLILNPYLGESYGNNIFKVRVADESKGKGKSGGFRIFYYLVIKTDDGDVIITLMTIINKGELNFKKERNRTYIKTNSGGIIKTKASRAVLAFCVIIRFDYNYLK